MLVSARSLVLVVIILSIFPFVCLSHARMHYSSKRRLKNANLPVSDEYCTISN